MHSGADDVLEGINAKLDIMMMAGNERSFPECTKFMNDGLRKLKKGATGQESRKGGPERRAGCQGVLVGRGDRAQAGRPGGDDDFSSMAPARTGRTGKQSGKEREKSCTARQ